MNVKSENDENGLCDDIYENMDITIESLEGEGFCTNWAALESLGPISTYPLDDGLPQVDVSSSTLCRLLNTLMLLFLYMVY